jgi:hypothetical protein
VSTSPTTNKNVPPPEVVQQRFDQWYQAMELSHEMLMAGLRARIGPDGDLWQAYRDWYDQYQAMKWQGAVRPNTSQRTIDRGEVSSIEIDPTGSP